MECIGRLDISQNIKEIIKRALDTFISSSKLEGQYGCGFVNVIEVSSNLIIPISYNITPIRVDVYINYYLINNKIYKEDFKVEYDIYSGIVKYKKQTTLRFHFHLGEAIKEIIDKGIRKALKNPKLEHALIIKTPGLKVPISWYPSKDLDKVDVLLYFPSKFNKIDKVRAFKQVRLWNYDCIYAFEGPDQSCTWENIFEWNENGTEPEKYSLYDEVKLYL
jgi:hypothetical protein